MSDISRRRPWLAALLALVVSGLGHAYLRRWARAFGWYVAITATVVLLVPDATVEGIFAGEPPPVSEVAPVLVVVAASVVDAYVVAVRNNREYERRVQATAADAKLSPGREDGPQNVRPDAANAPDGSDAIDAVRGGSTVSNDTAGADETVISCPSCGRKADPELDFCQWCAEPLDE